MLRTLSGWLLNPSIVLRTSPAVGSDTRYIKQLICFCSSTAQSTQTNELDKYLHYTSTDGYIKTSPFHPITIPDVTLDKYVWGSFRKWENKTAAVCVVTGRQYTYAQVRDNCATLAIRLQKILKLRPRDVIAICMPNLPEYPIAVFGSLEAGLTVTTVNPSYTVDEIARQITGSGAKCVIGTANNYNTLKEACKAAKMLLPIIAVRTEKTDSIPQGVIDFFELMDPTGISFSDLEWTDVTKDDLAFLPFSSGTTGLPKGVMLTHLNITSNCEMAQSQAPYEPHMMEATQTAQDVTPALLPFFHIYGLTVTMITNMKLGCKLVTIPKFTPDDFIRSLDKYKATSVNLVPPLILFLTNSEKVKPKHLKHLRYVMSGAAPIGSLDVERLLAKFSNIYFAQGYGLTETSPVVLISPAKYKKYSAVGFLVANTEGKIAAFDDNDAMGLGPNQVGELCIRGPQVMSGYLNNEEATRNTFYPNKWYRTGDVGYYDEEGYFYITDRMKELIKVKGFQVPPAELEEILRDHPKILDAAVIGCPHPKWGEVPKGFIVLRSGKTATEQEIKDFIASKVIHYKRLEGGVTFINEIPKTASGKILRKDLKAKYVKA